MSQINLVVTLKLADERLQQLQSLDERLRVMALSPAQRRVYRSGQAIWFGYGEGSEPETEDEQEARQNLKSVLGRAEVVLTTPIIPPDILSLAPNLRWLQLTSAGADRLIDGQLMRSNVVVTTASGVHTVTAGELILGFILSFAKGLPTAMHAQRERKWSPRMPQELYGKTTGIVGIGAIGGGVARLAKAFGMRVVATRRSAAARTDNVPDVDELLQPSGLEQLLAQSDYVVVAAPLTAETRHLIGEKELAAMKRSGVIINIARGALIDEKALVRVLKEKQIAGAGLDVFEQEPLPPDSELWAMDNVIITPHMAGHTPIYMERVLELFHDNLRRYLGGERLRNLVDPARGY